MDKILVTVPSLPTYEEYIEEIKSIWDAKYITNFGPKYQKFIELIKERYGYENVDMQCNGHMMLQNILSCIEPGEVITTPFTFISTTLAIANAGHTPVFCDINKETYNIDIDKIEELITPKTVAIVPVHVYGTPCDVKRIQEIADKHNLKVVYDAAHAFDVAVDGVPIGKFGNASMFSLHGTKVFNSIEGGMGVVKDKAMLAELKSRSNFGIVVDGNIGNTEYLGVNSKMNEFQASMGIVNLRHLDDNIKKRKELIELYDSNLCDIKSIRLLKRSENVKHNYAYYPVLVDNPDYSADGLMEFLENNGIFARRYFYPAANDMPAFNLLNKTPIAKEVSDNILCLPIYADLEKSQVLKICDKVKEYFQNEQ